MAVARADAEQDTKPVETINLADVVEQACGIARPLTNKHNLELTVSLSAPMANVLGDTTTLRRFFWTLLDSAPNYKHAPGRIDVMLSTTTDAARATARDFGVGISESDLPHIFDCFYRADPSRSHIEGAGLGLSIAKWVAEMHHANLTVASELNREPSMSWFPIY